MHGLVSQESDMNFLRFLEIFFEIFRYFFEIVLDENGDGSSSAHNNDSSSDKLITNEILKFPTTPSVGYHNNSRGLNSGSFTP